MHLTGRGTTLTLRYRWFLLPRSNNCYAAI
jgi:hypothetical protein